MKTGYLCAIGMVVLSLAAGSAKAGLTLGYPDITAEEGNVSYNSSGGSFSYQSYPLTVATSKSPSDLYNIYAGALTDFNLAAKISSSGQITHDGTNTLTVYADSTDGITPWGNNNGYSGTLLTASVNTVSAGTVNKNELLFTLTVTGGTWAGKFGGVGAPLGLDLHDDGSTTGTFASSFSMTGSAYSDVATTPVPEPATWAMVLLGGCVLAAMRKRFNPILAAARRA